MSFPFPRGYYGKLLEQAQGGRRKDRSSSISTYRPESHPAQDAAFAAAMRQDADGARLTRSTRRRAGNIGASCRVDVDPQAVAATSAFRRSIRRRLLPRPGPRNRYVGSRNATANERLFSLAAAAVTTFNGKPIDIASIPKFDEGGGPSVMLLLPPRHPASRRRHRYAQRSRSPDAASYRSPTPMQRARRQTCAPFAHGALIYVGATAAGQLRLTLRPRAVCCPGSSSTHVWPIR